MDPAPLGMSGHCADRAVPPLAKTESVRVDFDQPTIYSSDTTLTDNRTTMATIFYARVSTKDQTIEHQRTQAEAAGFKIDRVVSDHGISGISTRLAERPEGKRLFDILRSGDTLVVRWVDRLGRNYSDVCDTIREFMRRGVVIRTVINGLTFDGATKDPMQQAVRDALIAFMAATAQANSRKPNAVVLPLPRPRPRQRRSSIEDASQATRGINSRRVQLARSVGRYRRDREGNGLKPSGYLSDQGRSGGSRGGTGLLGNIGRSRS